jgi:hypothetical protein
MRNLILGALAALSFTSSAHAATNLVTNGGFESTTNGIGQMDAAGAGVTDATGWATTGYNFIMDSNVDSTGVNGQYGFLALWGPNSGSIPGSSGGSANGFSASPTGGNFLGADGAFSVAAVTQTINGMVSGQKYVVSFDWAGAQQFGYDNSQTEQWEVGLGGQSQFTSIYTNASHGFSGWMHDSFTFTATSSSEVLSFIAHGTPNGVPPFSLLDGVSVIAAPEPEAWAMMVLGFGALGLAMRRRQKRTLALSAA